MQMERPITPKRAVWKNAALLDPRSVCGAYETPNDLIQVPQALQQLS
jgi:hypothetical protein